jgi:hypothetical protein
MSDLKPKGTKIKLGKNEYGMRFTINAIDDIQDKFDITIEDLTKLFKDSKTRFKNLKYLLALLINEDIDCVKDETGEEMAHVDERYVGRHIDSNNMKDTMETILRAFTNGIPEGDDEAPNAQSV